MVDYPGEASESGHKFKGIGKVFNRSNTATLTMSPKSSMES